MRESFPKIGIAHPKQTETQQFFPSFQNLDVSQRAKKLESPQSVVAEMVWWKLFAELVNLRLGLATWLPQKR
jgi:hypothetical protein